MNKNIKSIYVINKNNATICSGTNFKEIYDCFIKREPQARNYMFFYRKLKDEDQFDYEINGSKYLFQRLH